MALERTSQVSRAKALPTAERVGTLYGKFIAYPFEPDTDHCGIPAAHSLSSIQGYAITAVRVVATTRKAAQHIVNSEFATVSGLVRGTTIRVSQPP
jgi:DNA-directed RNA polymerase alpha subunit